MRTEKLSNNYINPGPLVKSVKQSVVSLYRLLAEVVEERNENALLDFFGIESLKIHRGRKRNRKNQNPYQKSPKSLKSYS